MPTRELFPWKYSWRLSGWLAAEWVPRFLRAGGLSVATYSSAAILWMGSKGASPLPLDPQTVASINATLVLTVGAWLASDSAAQGGEALASLRSLRGGAQRQQQLAYGPLALLVLVRTWLPGALLLTLATAPLVAFPASRSWGQSLALLWWVLAFASLLSTAFATLARRCFPPYPVAAYLGLMLFWELLAWGDAVSVGPFHLPAMVGPLLANLGGTDA